MKLADKIKELESGLQNAQAARSALVNSHLEQINKVIEDEILKLKKEIQQSAIDTVCGQEYKVLTEAIENYKKGLATFRGIQEDKYLLSIMEDISEEKDESPLEKEVTEETEAEDLEEKGEVNEDDNV